MLSDTAAREAAARRSRLIGIALICGAVGTFACLDTTAKYLGREIAVMQVVWARYTFAFLLTLPISNPIRRRPRAALEALLDADRRRRRDQAQY